MLRKRYFFKSFEVVARGRIKVDAVVLWPISSEQLIDVLRMSATGVPQWPRALCIARHQLAMRRIDSQNQAAQLHSLCSLNSISISRPFTLNGMPQAPGAPQKDPMRAFRFGSGSGDRARHKLRAEHSAQCTVHTAGFPNPGP